MSNDICTIICDKYFDNFSFFSSYWSKKMERFFFFEKKTIEKYKERKKIRT